MAPVGRAAPPTEAARAENWAADAKVRAGLEIFAQYSYRDTAGPGDNRTWFHAFDVPRVHGAVEGQWEAARGRVVLEATRSASEGSLIGVAGDSLVLRVREAYAAYRAWDVLDVSAGVVPTLTVPELDGTWMLRPIAPSGLEASGLLSPADLGAYGGEGTNPCQVESVYFDFDSPQLKPEVQEQLKSLAECMKQQGGKLTILEAHADARGTEEYNIMLTDRRGQAVKEFLQQLGVDPNMMQVISKGDLEATGTDDGSMTKDRRVDFKWNP